eukprot:3904375-Pyramimonas_sp.AAC.1
MIHRCALSASSAKERGQRYRWGGSMRLLSCRSWCLKRARGPRGEGRGLASLRNKRRLETR